MLEKREGALGPYWILDYTIGIKFGGTEFRAFVEWEEKVGSFQCASSLCSDISLIIIQGAEMCWAGNCHTIEQHR